MWLIVYQYKGDNGSTVDIRSPMRDGQPVTIGRSNQCVLHIKNDKSISRKHIQFVCKRMEESLEVENFGKVTAYDNNYLKVGEKIDVSLKDSSNPIIFALGTLPEKVTIRSLRFKIIVSEPKSIEVQQVLASFFIELTTDPTFYPDSFCCVVADRNVSPLLYLYSAVTRSPVVTSRFIDALIDGLQNNCSNMDTLYEQTLDQYELDRPNINRYIKDAKFIYLNKDYGYENQLTTTLTNFFSRVGSDFKVFDDNEPFESYLQLRNILKNVVVIRHEERNVSQKILEVLGGQLNIYTTNEFLEELRHKRFEEILFNEIELKHNIERQVVEVSATEPIDENLPSVNGSSEKQARALEEPIEPSPVPTKKKRLTRRKVQPLNPLQLFAGGTQPNLNSGPGSGSQLDSIGNSTATIAFAKEKSKLDENLSNATTETPKGVISRDSSVVDGEGGKEEDTVSSTKLPSNSKHGKVLTTRDLNENQSSLTANKKSMTSSLKGKLNEDDAPLKGTDPVSDHKKSGKHRLDTTHNKEGNLVKIETVSDGPTPVKRRKVAMKKDSIKLEGDADNDDTTVRKPTLVETIQTTKNKEIDRFRNNMVEVSPEELTEDAINEFSTLSIVEAEPMLLKKESQRRNGDSNDVKYGNRPNYKRFVKRWAKGSGDSKESLLRSVDMFTRQYVETRPYSAMDKYTSRKYGDDEMGAVFAQGDVAAAADEEEEEEEEEVSLPSANTSKGVGLFIESSDEEEGVAIPMGDTPLLLHPSSDVEETVPPMQRPINYGDIDSDDDSDEGPKFQFKSKKK